VLMDSNRQRSDRSELGLQHRAPTMPLTGRWRIVEMDMWDRDAIDLIEPGFIESAHQGCK
jgi:hypothetical protein